jgi:hypothetical protein
VGIDKKKAKGVACYRTIMPQSFCSTHGGFYLQPIILEFSFQEFIPSHRSKTTFLLPRWKKGEKTKVQLPDGSFREYPLFAFYVCVNRDLARRGTFRQAHHAAGRVVALVEKLGEPVNKQLPIYRKLSREAFGRAARDVFDLQRAMTRRNLIGAPGTKEVAKQLAKWREIL